MLGLVDAGDNSQEAVLAALRAAPAAADARDRALLTTLVYGVLRQRRRLDRALSPLAPRGLPIGDSALMNALRIGAYQLLWLERVPAFAAVDTAVQLAARGGPPKARRGFANALLRALARAGEPPLSDSPSPAALAERHSLPTWVVTLLLQENDAAPEPRLAAENEPAPFFIRLNLRRTDRDAFGAHLQSAGVPAEPVAGLPGALRLARPAAVVQSPSLGEGLWLPQDAASQLVVHLLEPQPGERVADVCAGAGVKTSHLAELVGPQGHVAALDVEAERIRRLGELVRRWGVAEWVSATAGDATRPDPAARQAFDRVLVDAPCSGLGVLRRRPEIRWRRRPEDLARLVPLQRRLIEAAAGSVRPGGVLVYAVCSWARAEGPDVVDQFLASPAGADFTPDSAAGASCVAPFLDPSGALRTSPDRGGLDAFFAVRLRRSGGAA